MFDRLLKNIDRLDLNDIFFEIWQRTDIQRLIIELNTEGQPTSQLFELGEDSEGDTLGAYSPFNPKSQFFDTINLKETGIFYGSFRVQPTRKGFSITANPIRGDSNLFEDFGVEIVGLQEGNILVLLDHIEPLFEEELEKRLLR